MNSFRLGFEKCKDMAKEELHSVKVLSNVNIGRALGAIDSLKCPDDHHIDTIHFLVFGPSFERVRLYIDLSHVLAITDVEYYTKTKLQFSIFLMFKNEPIMFSSAFETSEIDVEADFRQAHKNLMDAWRKVVDWKYKNV